MKNKKIIIPIIAGAVILIGLVIYFVALSPASLPVTVVDFKYAPQSGDQVSIRPIFQNNDPSFRIEEIEYQVEFYIGNQLMKTSSHRYNGNRIAASGGTSANSSGLFLTITDFNVRDVTKVRIAILSYEMDDNFGDVYADENRLRWYEFKVNQNK